MIDPKHMKEYTTPGDTGTGAVLQLTITTVYEVLKRPPLLWERYMIAVNQGYTEWSIAAVILGINSLHPAYRDLITNAWQMHLVPLTHWREHFKTWLVALRRCPILFDDPSIPPEEVLMMRKVMTCTYRSREEADWAGEQHRRMVNIPIHFGVTEEGLVSRALWKSDLRSTCGAIAQEVVSAAVGAARLDTLQEWWDSRWAWAPGGSSSNRHVLAGLKEVDSRLLSAARPNKKSVMEALPRDHMHKLFKYYPPLYVARASTKPEPGGKSRALYAVSDEAFLISGYASVHLEKHMNVWGIKAKQTPSDVVDWIAAGERRKPNSVWVSLDYSDYNTEHELETLAMFNWQLAVAWSKQSRGRRYRPDKVHAAVWAARAHLNAWVEGVGDAPWRVMAGLYSGDRDTARDNTGLHGVYSRMALKYTQQFDPAAELLNANYTGDDEDSLMNDWVAALIYLGMHRLMNFELKPAKQMVDGVVHEFLQRMTIPDATPTRPIFAALSQLASGNWYKDVFIWYDTAIQSISDNCWELVSRGMPLIYGRRLAVEYLNATMRVPDRSKSISTADGDMTWRRSPTVWKRLEWWKYRNGGQQIHPLWNGTGPLGLPPPTVTAKPTPHEAAPTAATDDWISAKQVELGSGNTKAWEVYRGHCLKEAYGALYVTTRADAHAQFALDVWPERTSIVEGLELPTVAKPDQATVLSLVLSNPIARRPAKEEEVLARMGLDAALVAAFGGLSQVLQLVRPSDLQHYSLPLRQGVSPPGYAWLDPALRAWHGATGVAQVSPVAEFDIRLQRNWPRMDCCNIDEQVPKLVYLAPNCAGKSRFVLHNPWCADSDKIVSSMQLHAALHHNSKNPIVPRHPAVGEAVDMVLLRQGYQGLTTQMDPRDILPPSNQRSYRVAIFIIDVPFTILRTRMALRGWNSDKIERRLLRWQGIIARFRDDKEFLSPAEQQQIRILKEFPTYS